MKKETSQTPIEHKVVVYPAMTERMNGKQIYFLLSLYQVEDIHGELHIYPVPFSDPFIEGVAVWRNMPIPVMSMERYLGLPFMAPDRGQRVIVLRSALETQDDKTEMRVAIKTNRDIKMVPVPESVSQVQSNGWMNHDLVKGVFEWEKGFIVVPEVDQVFRGDGI